jgi:hypothetical protein
MARDSVLIISLSMIISDIVQTRLNPSGRKRSNSGKELLYYHPVYFKERLKLPLKNRLGPLQLQLQILIETYPKFIES